MHLCLKNLNCHKKSSHRPTKNSQRTLHYDSLELEFVNSLRNGIHIFRILNVKKFSFKFIGGLWILNNVALDEWEKVCGAGPGSGELSSAARVDLWLVRVPSVPASLGPGTRYRGRRAPCSHRGEVAWSGAHTGHYIKMLARVQTTYFSYLGKQ